MGLELGRRSEPKTGTKLPRGHFCPLDLLLGPVTVGGLNSVRPRSPNPQAHRLSVVTAPLGSTGAPSYADADVITAPTACWYALDQHLGLDQIPRQHKGRVSPPRWQGSRCSRRWLLAHLQSGPIGLTCILALPVSTVDVAVPRGLQRAATEVRKQDAVLALPG